MHHHQSFSRECFFPERINVYSGGSFSQYAKAKKTINFLFAYVSRSFSFEERRKTADVFLGTACFKNYRGFLGLSAFFFWRERAQTNICPIMEKRIIPERNWPHIGHEYCRDTYHHPVFHTYKISVLRKSLNFRAKNISLWRVDLY